jgi:hypothetical protein
MSQHLFSLISPPDLRFPCPRPLVFVIKLFEVERNAASIFHGGDADATARP